MLIVRERKRQVEEEGWSAAHDDRHRGGELAWAAIAYAAPAPVTRDGPGVSYDPWPWSEEWDKRPGTDANRGERIRALVKAGALIAAEIDRLDRADPDKGHYDDTLEPAAPSETVIATNWLDRVGRCETGRCGDCDWCEFLLAFPAERVLELLDADVTGFLARHGESIATNLDYCVGEWRGTPEGLAGVKAALAEIERRAP